MFCYTAITFAEELFILSQSHFLYWMWNLPTEKLPRQTAWDESQIVKVSVGNKIYEHPQVEANLHWVNVGLVKVRMDVMWKGEKGIE